MDGQVLDVKRGDRIDFAVPALPLPDTTKNTAGYPLAPGMDWIDLFTGSEGTLGIVIEAELQLLPAPVPAPHDVLAGVVFFGSDNAALDAVDAWRDIEGLSMIEYFDEKSLAFLRQRFDETPENAGAALLIEQENGDIDFWAEHAYPEHAPNASWFAASDQDRDRFRRFRHALPELVNDTMRRRGFLKLGSDYAVPLARNREMLAYYHAGLRQHALDYVIFGHIGDAHVHVNILPKSQAEFEAGQRLMFDFARHAVELGGTVSAEHGLGKRKAHLLEQQYTPAQIESMKEVKRRLDPRWLLNRGNLFA
jgi:FAD/FMN-containing dehydrogenase